MRLHHYSLLLTAAAMSTVVLCVDQEFNIKNETPIPIKVTVEFEGTKQSKNIEPQSPYPIPIWIELGRKGLNKELKQFTLSTPGGNTVVNVGAKYSIFRLKLSGPEKGSQAKPVYHWELTGGGGFGTYPTTSGKFE